MIREFFGDREFYRIFFNLAVPVTLQYFISASLNLIDGIMVGQLGATELAAVGLANQVTFMLLLFLLGVAGGTSIFVAQFWGRRDIQNIRRVLGLGTIISVTVALVFSLVNICCGPAIIKIFSDDPEVVALGGRFLSITSLAYVLMALSACYAAALRSTGEVKLPMRANILAIVTNTGLNFLLIFGNFGLPGLGVTGAAVATVIARFLETTILLLSAYRNRSAVAARFSEMFDIPADLVKNFISSTGTVVAKDLIWAIGVTVYMVVYARMGTDVVASINIINTVRQLAFVLFNGIAAAAMVMVGNQIGSGDEAKAFRYAQWFLTLTLLIGVVMGVLLITGSRVILSPYKVSGAVIQGAKTVLFVTALYMPAIVFNMVAVVGVLRSGGDTMFCLIMDLVAVYLIGLPLAIVGQAVWKLPVAGVYALITSQEIFKMILCLKRFGSKRWIHNLVDGLNYHRAVEVK
ncbi:MAG TPA: MATE family efflux transporter [Bacillota bacterium]